jgi:putative peptidoglycan binding protein
MRKRLLLSTVALVAGLAITPTVNMPAGAQGAAQPQGGAAKQERQQQGGQAQQHSQDQGKQGQSQRSQGQAQSKQSNESAGQAQHGQRDQSKQGQRQDQGKQGPAQRSQSQEQPNQTTGQREQSKQGQRDQGMQQGQSKRDQAQQRKEDQRNQTTGQGQRDQTTGQGQRDQTQGQAPQRQQPAQGQAQQPQQGQTQQGQAQQGQAQQGQASGAVNLTSEQRTRIQQTVFARNDLPRVNNVNSLAVGTAVPASVRIVDLDPVLIEYFPQYRGHKYFVVRDEIVIVDNSRKVVAVMPVGSGRGGARLDSGGPKVSGGAGAIDLAPDQIRQVQMVLIEKGFDIGEPDGRLGPRTTRALIAFQRQQGFQATGRIDSRTMTALGVSSTTGQGNQGANQPSTSGQGGGGVQPPANQNMGAGEQGNQNQPSTSGQGGAGQQPSANQNLGDGKQDAKEPSTTGQGSEKMQPSGKDNPGAEQTRPMNRPADQRSNPDSGR